MKYMESKIWEAIERGNLTTRLLIGEVDMVDINDDWKPDRRDRDFSYKCQKHRDHADQWGNCPECLIDNPYIEERIKEKKAQKAVAERWAKQIRAYEDWKPDPEEEKLRDEEAYLRWREKERVDD